MAVAAGVPLQEVEPEEGPGNRLEVGAAGA